MDKWGGRRAQKFTRMCLETYGTACHIQRPGCTRVATTADHIIPLSLGGPVYELSNLRPACAHCNSSRGDGMGAAPGQASITVVVGPPAAGKSTYVREHAAAADVVIDLDQIASALRGPNTDPMHVYPDHIRHVAIGARQAAIRRAERLRERVGVWIIHSMPSASQLADYHAKGYRVVTIDPGSDVVTARAHERPASALPHIDRFYVRQGASAPPSRTW